MHHWPKAQNILLQCGPYQMQAVLRVRGKEVEIEELYFTDLLRQRDWTVPWHMPAILRRHGVESKMRLWLRRSFARNLRHSIEHGKPVIILINSIQGNGYWHWISAWGYDAGTDEFLCYDSQAESATSPHGNIRYTSAQLISALPWSWTAVVEVMQ